MRTYKLFIQEYNIMENDYITREEIVKTNDIYHEIGKIYCQSFVKIKRIDYLDITKDLEKEIERLNNIINEIEKYAGLGEINWEDKYQDIMLSGKGLLKRIKEVRELCSKQLKSNTNITGYSDEMCLKDI